MKKVYKMLDGVPLYKHLKNGSVEYESILSDHDYGKFAEVLGKKIINYSLGEREFLGDIFPGISIVSFHKIISRRKTRRGAEKGDISLEISYKNRDEYGKKIIVFEIKYGVSRIKQQQIKRYCDMIEKPGEYFPKADEVKVIYMFFNKIDTVNGSIIYQMCELNRDLVNKILQSEEQREIKDSYIKEMIIKDSENNLENKGDEKCQH